MGKTMNQLVDHKVFVPSAVYAERPHESRSLTYAHISTARIAEVIQDSGFVLRSAAARKVRKADRQGFQKHLLRFVPTNARYTVIGDSVPEIIVSNAHDGTGGINIFAGLFRLVCLNGLIVQSAEFAHVSLPHRGRDLEGRVIDAAYTVIQDSERAALAIQDWQKIELTRQKQLEFAEAAMDLKYGPNTFDKPHPIEAFQILQPRREDDSARDLWRVFNVAQENLIRGGLRGRIGPRTVTTRAVRGAESNLALNRQLWALADSYAKAA
jgi:hypothetical protein